MLPPNKSIDCGFVLICPTYNKGQISTTINSIHNNYSQSKYTCVVPSNCPKNEIVELKKITKLYVGEQTITSLINVGMQNAPCSSWNFIVIGGTWIKSHLDRKFAYFIKGEKDILFPLVDRRMNFVDGSINGILIHKRTFDMIGLFQSDSPLDISKLYWALEAVDKGCTFKAILGTTIC